MESLKITLTAYGFTIVFAMLIACLIPGLAALIKRAKLDQDETLDLTVPSANSMKEDEAIAVAIAAATRAQQK